MSNITTFRSKKRRAKKCQGCGRPPSRRSQAIINLVNHGVKRENATRIVDSLIEKGQLENHRQTIAVTNRNMDYLDFVEI
jgi:hypothetical protein